MDDHATRQIIGFATRQRRENDFQSNLTESQAEKGAGGNRMSILVSTIETSNRENLDGIKETSFQMRGEIDLLRNLTEQLKDLQSPYERKYRRLTVDGFTTTCKTPSTSISSFWESLNTA